MKMKKLNRMVGIILTMCILISILMVGQFTTSALEVSSDGEWEYIYYSETDSGSLVKYLGTKTTITLPETIDGIRMTSVGLILDDLGTLRHVTVPKCYTTITFSDSKIKSVTCSREYTDADTAVNLDQFGAFARCSYLEKVVLPNKVSNYGMAHYDSGDGTGWRWHEKAIELSAYTFKNCKKLKEVILPDNIVYIGAEAFTNCTSLTSITIPNGVKYIGEQSFMGCNNLSLVYLPESIESIASITGCDACTFVCPAGSYAYEYVKNREKEYLEMGYDVSYTIINSDPVDLGGDANGDGKLDINDVTLIQMHLAHLLPYNISNGDTNEDGKVSISDATQIQKILVS